MQSAFLEKKPIVIRRLNNTELNDISSMCMHLASTYMHYGSFCLGALCTSASYLLVPLPNHKL